MPLVLAFCVVFSSRRESLKKRDLLLSSSLNDYQVVRRPGGRAYGKRTDSSQVVFREKTVRLGSGRIGKIPYFPSSSVS